MDDLAERIVALIKNSSPSRDEIDTVSKGIEELASPLRKANYGHCVLVPEQRVQSDGCETLYMITFHLWWLKNGELGVKEEFRREKETHSACYEMQEFIERCARAKYVSFSEWSSAQVKERMEKMREEDGGYVDILCSCRSFDD